MVSTDQVGTYFEKQKVVNSLRSGLVMSAVNGMQYVPVHLQHLLPCSIYRGITRQYLDYFHIGGADAGGGVGTTTAIIFGIVSLDYILFSSIF